MANDRRTFVFNVAWAEVLWDYPAEVCLEVYDAIIRYVASGTLTELKPLSSIAFSFIKHEMDYNRDKYDNIVAQRSAAGKKGGAPPGNRNAAKHKEETSKTNKSNITSYNDNVYDNDIDIENDNDNNNVVIKRQ